jgi:Holliday junction resolvase
MSAVARAAVERGRLIKEQVARRLVREGYDVVVEPGPDLLPPDLARFRPDILARRGEEKLIVEIKARSDRPSGSQIQELARLVRAKPGWHFELVVAPPEPTESESGTTWTAAEAAARVAEAEALVDAGHDEAGLLLAYAAAEAAARHLAERAGMGVQWWSPPALFRQLVHAGLLDRQHVEALDRTRISRNQLVHGLTPDGDVGPQVRKLAQVARELLAEDSRPAAMAD